MCIYVVPNIPPLWYSLYGLPFALFFSTAKCTKIVRKRLCHSGIMTQKADTSRHHSRQKKVSNPLPVEGHVEVLKREPHTKSTGQNKNSTSDRPISNPSPLAQGAWASPYSSKLLPPTLQLLNIPHLFLAHHITLMHPIISISCHLLSKKGPSLLQDNSISSIFLPNATVLFYRF